jgi:kynureninase
MPSAPTLLSAHSREAALALDRADALAGFRAEFEIPLGPDGQPSLYFCGNSLGPMPKAARTAVAAQLDEWARLGVAGHFAAEPTPWLRFHTLLGPSLARLVGAGEHEVIAMNTLTINLHLMMATFFQPTTERFQVLLEEKAFPSDVYAVKSQLRLHDFPENGLVWLRPRVGEDIMTTAHICEQIDACPQAHLLLLGAVNYFTGQAFDVPAITAHAHSRGLVVGLDLAHAIGNIPMQLHDWDVDFAIWCSYKYLNGGPGATAGAYLHERHARRTDLPRLAGWWGHAEASRFQMAPDFVPEASAEGWQVSTPIILSTAPLVPREKRSHDGLSRRRTRDLTPGALCARHPRRPCPARQPALAPRADGR